MTILIGIPVVILSAWLWRKGGQSEQEGGIWWARNIIGLLIGIVKAFLIWNVLALVYGLLLWAMMALFSYGLNAPPHKFWVWIFKKGEDGNCLIVELCTRLTCGLFWCSAGVLFGILTGRLLNTIVYVLAGTLLVGFFGLIKKVEVSECGTGASVALSVFV